MSATTNDGAWDLTPADRLLIEAKRWGSRLRFAVMLLFFDLHRASKSDGRGAAGFVERHPAADVLLGQHGEMGLDLAIEVVVKAAREQQAADARDGDGQPGGHDLSAPRAAAAAR